VDKGPNHVQAPIPEEVKLIQAKKIKDISGIKHVFSPVIACKSSNKKKESRNKTQFFFFF